MKFLSALIVSLLSCFAQAAPIGNYMGRLTLKSVTVESGSTGTSAHDLAGYSLVGITFPTTFTGTTVTFTEASTSAGTYRAVYNSSGQVSKTVAQNRYYAMDPIDFQGIRFLKIVGSATEGGERTLILHLKGTN